MRYKTESTCYTGWRELDGINEFCIKRGDSINLSGLKLLLNGRKLISHSLPFYKSNFWPACVCVRTTCALLKHNAVIGIFMSSQMETIIIKASVPSTKGLVLIWFLRDFQFNLNIHLTALFFILSHTRINFKLIWM